MWYSTASLPVVLHRRRSLLALTLWVPRELLLWGPIDLSGIKSHGSEELIIVNPALLRL